MALIDLASRLKLYLHFSYIDREINELPIDVRDIEVPQNKF